MTELRFAVFSDAVLQVSPRLTICLYLLAIGTNGQNATNRFGNVNYCRATRMYNCQVAQSGCDGIGACRG
jgi:hypothetical protein